VTDDGAWLTDRHEADGLHDDPPAGLPGWPLERWCTCKQCALNRADAARRRQAAGGL
jgi:hypothetical protein